MISAIGIAPQKNTENLKQAKGEKKEHMYIKIYIDMVLLGTLFSYLTNNQRREGSVFDKTILHRQTI